MKVKLLKYIRKHFKVYYIPSETFFKYKVEFKDEKYSYHSSNLTTKNEAINFYRGRVSIFLKYNYKPKKIRIR